MPRSRNIKPGFFENDDLGTLDSDARLLFIALWTLADCQGVIEAKISKIRTYVFRYRADITDQIVQKYIHQLVLLDGGRVLRYMFYADRAWLIIHNFVKHQTPHHTEKKGDFPTLDMFKDAVEVPIEAKKTSLPLSNGYTTVAISLIPDSCSSTVDPGFTDSRGSVDHSLSKNTQNNQKNSKPLTTFVEKKILDEFNEFWTEYGRIGNKDRAKKAYLKVKKEGIKYENIFAGLRRYQSQCIALGKQQQYIQHASTWLNARGWEDDYPISPTTKPNKYQEILNALDFEE